MVFGPYPTRETGEVARSGGCHKPGGSYDYHTGLLNKALLYKGCEAEAKRHTRVKAPPSEPKPDEVQGIGIRGGMHP